MSHNYQIGTERLRLRAFKADDAEVVHKLAGAFEIADTTLCIPHPYERSQADEWITSHKKRFEDKIEIVFAITLKLDSQLIGSISLTPRFEFDQAELGYWIGKPYWSKGYASEAVKGLIKFGFEQLNLNRVHAHHFVRNPASGKVLNKCGMKYEGTLRQHIKKDDRYEDIDFYGILKSECNY